MKTKNISRRELIKQTSFAIGGLSLLNTPVSLFGKNKDARTRVVLIRDERIPAYGISADPSVVKEMLNKAVCALLDEKDSATAWRKLIKPSDIVGIKTNEWKSLPTPHELEEAIKQEVIGAGVNADKVSITDRSVKSDPVFQKATALINTRPMRTHAWSGVGTLMKNYIMFAERPADYHPDSCADLAKLFELPMVKDKTRLHILVMFTPQFQSIGSHSFSPDYTWAYKGLLVGTDPVALDATGLRIIQAKRNEFFKEDRPLNPPAKHIELADTRHHLGTADMEKIEIIKLGWMDNCFV